MRNFDEEFKKVMDNLSYNDYPKFAIINEKIEILEYYVKILQSELKIAREQIKTLKEIKFNKKRC